MSERYNVELYRMKAEICKTFADPTRLMIINEVRSGEKSVSDLQNALSVPQPLISRHLSLLRERGIVKTRRAGTNVFYSISDTKILEACDIVHNVLLNQMAKNKEFAERLITLHSKV